MTNSDVILSSAVIFTLFILLAAAVVTDLRSHRIPNILLAPALSLALLLNTVHAGADGLALAAGGFAAGLLLFLPLYAIGGMGAGDVKLMAVVGSFVGPMVAIVAGLAAMVAGSVIGIVAIVWRRVRPILELRAAQRLDPAVGLHAPDAPSSAPRQRLTYIAYAPAIAIGTVAALWYFGYLPQQLMGWMP